MQQIGFFIPEFPVQTHAFFIRERLELKKLDVDTVLISTRSPKKQKGLAAHQWAEEASRETTYLFPLNAKHVLSALLEIACSGPTAWLRCARMVLSGDNGLSPADRLKMPLLILTGAHLKRFARARSLDHIHVHSCANAANVALFAQVLGGPSYSMTLHGPLRDYGGNQVNKWKHAKFCLVITENLMAETERVLGQHNLPPRFLAPMGVNTDVFHRSSPYRAPSRDEQVRIVSCGRLNYVKAHDDLIRAVAHLKEIGITARLHICGAMDAPSQEQNYEETLRALMRELGVEDSVELLGSVSEQRVIEELEHCHFFCLASLHEPLGVATMEAMSMEVPVVVSESPGVAEMVRTGVDGFLVKPRSPKDIAACIEKLIENQTLALDVARRARQRIVENYHSGISASKIKEGLDSTG